MGPSTGRLLFQFIWGNSPLGLAIISVTTVMMAAAIYMVLAMG